MVAGAAGPHGDPALVAKGQGLAAVITLRPVEVASTALVRRRSSSLVITQTSSTYSTVLTCVGWLLLKAI